MKFHPHDNPADRHDLEGDLGPMLRSHLSRRLDPQLGRAPAAFEQEPAGPADRIRAGRWRIPVAAGALIAAMIAIAWALFRPAQSGPIPRDGAKFVEKDAPAPDTFTQPDLDPGGVERLVTWRAFDEGSRVIDASLPVRKLRVESVEEIRWDDDDLGATVRLSVPQAQVILVRQQTF